MTPREDWPQWLRDADTEGAQVEVVNGRVHWRGGDWRGGYWLGGDWLGGDWRGGTWHGGDWHGGYWRGGVWLGGDWHGGVWLGGTWRGGDWHGGDWHGGYWRGGVWLGGDWHGGDWRERIDQDGAHIPAASVGVHWHGECGRTLRVWRCPQRGWIASCGCFCGSISELREYIRTGDGNMRSSRTRVLRAAIALLRGRV